MRWIALRPPAEPASAPWAQGASGGADTLQALGWHALGFTPRVTLLEDAVLLEVSASVRLFGGAKGLLQQLLLSYLESNKAIAQVGYAQGATSLIAIGRLRSGLPEPESSRLAAGALPFESLSAARLHAGVLARMGCRHWDDLRRLPRDGVARRFGQPLLDALDQAFGVQPESHAWLSVPEVFEVKLELPALVDNASALMFAVHRLLGHLRVWLKVRSSGLLAVELSWQLDPRRDASDTGALTVRMSEPSQDMAHVARLLAEHLAHVRLPAPAHTICLRSLETTPLTAASHSLLPEERRQGDSLAQLVERLSARLGPAQVRRWQACARHVPERMQRWVAAEPALSSQESGSAAERQRISQRMSQASPVSVCRPEALFPSWLLHEPLQLALVNERPCYEGPLMLLAGPQRIETTGWVASPISGSVVSSNPTPAAVLAESPVMRDYFIARSETAGLLWIFRQRPNSALSAGSVKSAGAPKAGAVGWYLHGIFA